LCSGNSLFSDLYQYAQGTPALSEAQEEANKQMVVAAYSGLFNDRKIELLEWMARSSSTGMCSPINPSDQQVPSVCVQPKRKRTSVERGLA
jgi:hypothetical protein